MLEVTMNPRMSTRYRRSRLEEGSDNNFNLGEGEESVGEKNHHCFLWTLLYHESSCSSRTVSFKDCHFEAYLGR